MRNASVPAMLTLLTMLLPGAAMAAGKLTVTQQNFYALNSTSITGNAYARVENTGDAPVQYNAGLFEVYDASGDTMASTSRLNVYAKYLLPGEHGYVKVSSKLEDADTYKDAADYALTVSGKGSVDSETKYYPSTGEYQTDVEVSDYNKSDYLVATITNNTDETVYEIEVVMALLDAQGNILDIESMALTNSIGIDPGCSIKVRKTVSDDMTDAFERAGLIPASVDTLAYTYEDTDD